ncbi:MAG: tetratricopeptide repeat protein [Bacteroidota bacterium]
MKNLILSLFLVLITMYCYPQYGIDQVQIDSLKTVLTKTQSLSAKNKIYNLLWEATIDNEVDKALLYANKIIEIGNTMNNDTITGRGYNRLGIVYSYKNDYEKSTALYKKALTIFQPWEQQTDAGHVNLNIGWDYEEQDKADSSFIYFERALHCFEKQKDTFDIGTVYRALSDAYTKKGYYKLGLQNAIKALSILEQQKDTFEINMSYLDIARNYEELKDTLNAEKYLQNAVDYFETKNRKRWESSAKLRLAKLLANDKKRYAKAEEFFKEGLRLSEELDFQINVQLGTFYYGLLNKRLGKIGKAEEMIVKSLKIARSKKLKNGISLCLLELGNIEYSKGNGDLAIKYLQEGLEIARKGKLLEEQKKAYQILYELNAQSNPDQALAYHVNYKKINDSIFNIASANQIEELKIIYETEKKEQQIALQEKEITVLEQEAKISNQQKLLLGGGLGLSMIALGFGFYGFRQRTRRNELEKEKVETELAFRKKELTTHALHLAKKNEVLENVKLKAKDLKAQGDVKGYQELIKTINFDQQDDKNWESFTQYFEQVHKDFASNVKKQYPDVTKNELRFMALLKMNMSSKEIATILNISPDGIKKARQRLRKKMGLSSSDSLENTVLAI